MVYRINIGDERQIYFDHDTGMDSQWDSLELEYNYLDDLSRKYSVLSLNNSVQLNFSEIRTLLRKKFTKPAAQWA